MLLALTNGNDEQPESNARSTTTPPQTNAPITTAPPSTVPPSTVPPTTAPTTIDALIALVAANPAAYGEHGKDLLKKLQEVQQDNATKPDKARDRAAKTIEEISKWIDDGKLDPTIGSLAQQLLQPNATT